MPHEYIYIYIVYSIDGIAVIARFIIFVDYSTIFKQLAIKLSVI